VSRIGGIRQCPEVWRSVREISVVIINNEAQADSIHSICRISSGCTEHQARGDVISFVLSKGLLELLD
jgi:hypothetical protein